MLLTFDQPIDRHLPQLRRFGIGLATEITHMTDMIYTKVLGVQKAFFDWQVSKYLDHIVHIFAISDVIIIKAKPQ